MRTLNEIQQELIQAKEAEPALAGLNSTSHTAIWRLWIYIVAFCIHIHERLMHQKEQEIERRIADTRPHTRKWYREKAMAYQHGVELLPETDEYAPLSLGEGLGDRIVSNAAVVKMNNHLRIKTVKTVGDELQPLSSEELIAFQAYMNQVSDAGTFVLATSHVADDLKLHLSVYYNPMLMNTQGELLDGSDTEPVKKAINGYLKSVEFNGAFVESRLERAIERLPAVEMVNVQGAWSKYGNHFYEDAHASNIGIINEVRIPDAGYMRLDEEVLTIDYIPFTDYE